MALSNEDHKDVKNHLGKALANKVSKVTRDKNHPQAYSINGREVNKSQWDMWHHQKSIVEANQKRMKENSPESSKYAIRAKKIQEFNRTNPEMKSARKGYNDARAADGLSRKRGAFGIK